MSDRMPERKLNGSMERYQRYQREIRRGNGSSSGGARPQEFDENGFPVPQRSPGFLARVGRLLNPR